MDEQLRGAPWMGEDGSKMIGMFGMGDSEATWREVARVQLHGPEPDWEQMER